MARAVYTKSKYIMALKGLELERAGGKIKWQWLYTELTKLHAKTVN